MSQGSYLPVSSGAVSGPGVPLLRISSDGVPLGRAEQDCISAITVVSASRQQGSFSLEFNDPYFDMIGRSDGPFREGRKLEIALRHEQAGHAELTEVIRGTITAINVDLDDEDGLCVVVEGHDALNAASAGNVYVRYQEQWSDFEILQRIADTLHLELSADSGARREMSAAPPRARFQSGQSNLAFIVELAEEYGCDFWVHEKTLYFCRDISGKKKISLRRGGNLFRIAVRLSTSGQVATVETQAWSTQSAVAAHASSDGDSLRGYWGQLSDLAQQQLKADAQMRVVLVRDQEAAERRSKVEMRRMARQLITVEGATIGNPEMRVGSVVQLGNMGRFDGEYLVQSVRHQLGADGFRTDFTLCLHI